jgi:hypothetical protein
MATGKRQVPYPTRANRGHFSNAREQWLYATTDDVGGRPLIYVPTRDCIREWPIWPSSTAGPASPRGRRLFGQVGRYSLSGPTPNT